MKLCHSKSSVPRKWIKKSLPIEAVVRWCSVKKALSKVSQNSHENTCARVSSDLQLIKKETLPQMFFLL